MDVLNEKNECEAEIKRLEDEIRQSKDDFNILKRDLQAIEALENELKEQW